MWSMDYVQVPTDEEKVEEVESSNDKKKEQVKEENKKESTKKRVHELVKQMSISTEGSGILIIYFFLKNKCICINKLYFQKQF